MSVRSRRLFVGETPALGGASVLLFTCPPDRVALLKDVVIRVPVGLNVAVILAVRVNGALPEWVVFNGNISSVSSSNLAGRFIVLEDGDQLRLTCGVACTVYASGALLDGDPL